MRRHERDLCSFRPLYGLQAGHIDDTQFTVLVTVVIATAVIPTIIAQRFFQPPLPLAAARLPEAGPATLAAAGEKAGADAQEGSGVPAAPGPVGERTS